MCLVGLLGLSWDVDEVMDGVILGDDPGAVRVLGLPKRGSEFPARLGTSNPGLPPLCRAGCFWEAPQDPIPCSPGALSSTELLSPPPSVPEPQHWAPSRRQDFYKYSQVLTENQVGTTTSFTQF